MGRSEGTDLTDKNIRWFCVGVIGGEAEACGDDLDSGKNTATHDARHIDCLIGSVGGRAGSRGLDRDNLWRGWGVKGGKVPGT